MGVTYPEYSKASEKERYENVFTSNTLNVVFTVFVICGVDLVQSYVSVTIKKTANQRIKPIISLSYYNIDLFITHIILYTYILLWHIKP